MIIIMKIYDEEEPSYTGRERVAQFEIEVTA